MPLLESEKTGYRTRSIVVLPVLNKKQQVFAAMRMIDEESDHDDGFFATANYQMSRSCDYWQLVCGHLLFEPSQRGVVSTTLCIRLAVEMNRGSKYIVYTKRINYYKENLT